MAKFYCQCCGTDRSSVSSLTSSSCSKNPNGKYQNIMHHKFCVIDLKTVIHGSYNWTNKARWNKETISIDISRELAEKFASEFINLKT